MATTKLTQTGAQVQADLNLTENLQDVFSTSSTYAVGAYVIYNSKLWRCHTAVSSAGAWTGTTNWTEVKLSDLAIPSITIALSQVTSQDPVNIQLTNEQYNILLNNPQVFIDTSALGQDSYVWTNGGDDGTDLIYGRIDVVNYFWTDINIWINKTTKVASVSLVERQVPIDQIATYRAADARKLLAMDADGEGILTTNLPILTTAPTANNTEGGLILVVLTSEPATKYEGYIYYIVGSST